MEQIILVNQPVSKNYLKEVALRHFGDLVKAVVDVEKEVMAIGGELHADEEAFLLQTGSRQNNLWGINLYPKINGNDMIEFDSMINLRPGQNNRSRSVEDPSVRKKILDIVNRLIV